MKLYPYQVEAVQAITTVQRGIIKAPAGAGKTVIAAAAIYRHHLHGLAYKVLWLANTKEQLDQAQAACVALNVNLDRITFKCYQAAQSAKGFDLVILDEVHHVAAPVFRRWLDGYTGPRWGFSATPEREDDLKDDVFELIGPIVHEVPRHELVATGKLAKARVNFVQPNDKDEFLDQIEAEAKQRAKGMSIMGVVGQLMRRPIAELINRQPADIRKEIILKTELSGLDIDDEVRELRDRLQASPSGMQSLRKVLTGVADNIILSRTRWMAAQKYGIYENQKRNRSIIALASDQTETTLVLVGKIAHGEELSKMVSGSVVIHSTMKKRAETIAALRDGTIKKAFVTSLLEEGFDCPRAGVLIAASAGRSANKQEQRTGRVLREWSEKTHGTVYDFWDVQYHMLYHQARARAKTYFSLGYELKGNPEFVADIVKSIGVKLHSSTGFAKK
jgi:superfamily II DNA or RNA helicase